MDNWIHLIILTISTLFPITNPLGNAGIFLSMTEGENPRSRNAQAFKGAFFMFCILEVSFLGGSMILNFFGLSVDGIRIAGGLLITKFGFEQLQPHRQTTHSDAEHKEAVEKDDISFTPLAMPLLAGPGAIAAVIGIASMSKRTPINLIAVSAGILATCVVCWVILRESQGLMRFLGVNGANALTKIMGFLLLCIGVQLAVNGIVGAVKTNF